MKSWFNNWFIPNKTRVFKFTNVIVNGNLYIVNDADCVCGWCGYMTEASVDVLNSATQRCTIDYKIYYSQKEVQIVKQISNMVKKCLKIQSQVLTILHF